VVGLQRSTYYDIKHHKPNDSELRCLLLADAIADIHTRSRGTYGMLRVRAALEIERGLIVNKKLAWKILRELGLRGLPGPKKRTANLVNAATEEEPRQAQLRGQGHQPAVADRYHRAPDPRGQGLLLRGAGPLLTQSRRLGHRPALRVCARQRCLLDGRSFSGSHLIHGDPLGSRQPR